MLLAYASRTQNIRKIVDRLSFSEDRLVDILENPEVLIAEPFCLLTYTDLLGKVPEAIEIFLSNNADFLRAVAGSGNRNFGSNFCGAARKIHERYGVPLIAEFELSGDDRSIQQFRAEFEALCTTV